MAEACAVDDDYAVAMGVARGWAGCLYCRLVYFPCSELQSIHQGAVIYSGFHVTKMPACFPAST